MKKMGRRRVSIGNDNVALSQCTVSRVSRDPCGPQPTRAHVLARLPDPFRSDCPL